MSVLALALLALTLVVLIVVHEAGHALAARAFGVAVLEFAVGFGPVLVRWRPRRRRGPGVGPEEEGTLFTLRLLPLGGFARLRGMGAQEEEEEGEDSPAPAGPAREGPQAAASGSDFDSQTLLRRALIFLAGPAANLLLALVVLTGLFAFAGLPDPGSPGGVSHSPFKAALAALLACGRFVLVFADLVGGLVVGGAAITESLSGPVGIFQTGSEAISRGLFWLLVAFLSLNLAVFNLLPVLPLDGGHLIFLAAEKVLGRPVSARVRRTATNFGVSLFLTVALFATFGDVARLIGG